ncbi:Scr1 family TA system antitoxin-like transcriptional regulator [Streptomyces sp. URMC 129]|uniref:Scr1 family TA system antitoxin-like transcriptional regulator n=1 Tax=Streptomyces sp. URMC 129 TaxID=3423407 RepID=UPI003F1D75AF
MTSLTGWATALRDTDQRGVWRAKDLDGAENAIQVLTQLDRAADFIRVVDLRVVPALLQVPHYSLGVIKGINPRLSEREAKLRMLLKSARTGEFHQRLQRMPAPRQGEHPHLRAVIGEAALRYPWDPGSHEQQLRHLLRMAEHPNIRIYVLPMGVQAPMVSDHFVLYSTRPEAGRRESHAVFTEHAAGGTIATRADITLKLIQAFADLAAHGARSPEESRDMIRGEVRAWIGRWQPSTQGRRT